MLNLNVARKEAQVDVVDVQEDVADGGRGHRGKADPGPGGASWTRGTSMLTKLVSLVLAALLACGPIALLTGGGRAQVVSAPAEDVTVDTSSSESSVAGQVGLDVIEAWLGATTADHERLDELMGSGAAVGETALEYTDLSLVSVVSTQSPGVWSVTVSARVVVPEGRAEDGRVVEPAGTVRMAWSVPVAVTGTLEWTVLTWPAPTSLGQAASHEQVVYPASLNVSGAVATAAEEMVSAYVTGGDVSRLVSPGTEVTVLPAGVYQSAQLVEVRALEWSSEWETAPPEGTEIEVLAQVRLTSRSQAVSTSSWALTLVARAGRWEVLALRQAPETSEGDSK